MIQFPLNSGVEDDVKVDVEEVDVAEVDLGVDVAEVVDVTEVEVAEVVDVSEVEVAEVVDVSEVEVAEVVDVPEVCANVLDVEEVCAGANVVNVLSPDWAGLPAPSDDLTLKWYVVDGVNPDKVTVWLVPSV